MNVSKIIRDFESCKRRTHSYKKALRYAAKQNHTSQKVIIARIFGTR